jgi:hypothetical protein
MGSQRFRTLADLAVGFGLGPVTSTVPFSCSTAAIPQPETPIINFDPNAIWPR